MNRKQWLEPFARISGPHWACPWCGNGMLRLVKDSFVSKETADSRNEQPEYHDESLEARTFTCWLKCDGTCGEDVAVIGTSSNKAVYDEGPNGYPIEHYVEMCQPLLAEPMPPLFIEPTFSPLSIRFDLPAAFRLVWVDPGAAANRLRVAVEHLLDELGIPKEQNGKPLKLHGRIDLYEKKERTHGRHLMAIKWLGNTASHEGDVSREDLISAFQIIEHTLIELFEQPGSKIAELADELTKRHGPQKKI